MAWRPPRPGGSPELVGDLSTDRPPRYAALAARVRLLVADGRVPLGTRLPGRARPGRRARAEPRHGHRRLRPPARGRLGHRPPGRGHVRRPAGRPAPRRLGARPGWTTARSTWPTPHPSAPASVPAAFAAALAELPRYLPQHGYHPAGLPELRARIADRYTARGLPTTPEQVLVTAGALHGVVDGVPDRCCAAGSGCWSSSPPIPNALDAARALGARLLPVRAGTRRPGRLARRHRAGAARAPGPTAAYLMPDFQNPTGRLLDAAGRERLARALRRAGTTAVVDETVRRAVAGRPAAAAAGRLRRGPPVGRHAEQDGLGRAADRLGARRGRRRPPADRRRRPVDHGRPGRGAAGRLRPAGRRRDRARRSTGAAARAAGRADGGAARPPPRLAGARAARRAGALVRPAGAAVARAGLGRGAATGCGWRPGPLFGTGHALDDRLRLPFTQPPEVLRTAVGLLAKADADAERYAGPAAGERAAADPVV